MSRGASRREGLYFGCAPATELLMPDPTWNLVFVEDGHSLFVREDSTGTFESLRVVAPGFREGRLLDREVSDAEIDAELDRRDPPEAHGVLHGWLRGLQALRPLARDGAMAASSACDTDAARSALARASVAGPSRETALAELELTLRGPDGAARDNSLSHLAKLRDDPRTGNDPWVLAIAAETDANVRCP